LQIVFNNEFADPLLTGSAYIMEPLKTISMLSNACYTLHQGQAISPNESTCHMIKVKLVASELVAVVFCVMISMGSIAQTTTLERAIEKKRVRLPNGWHLSPVGRTLSLGDLPLNIAVSSTKKYMAVTNNGQAYKASS
jgi:hypothetical protein